ncbi:uncharacterized protein LOC129270315 [Lytechinus pictus]|uniref:uncharacterized protein LOC129270315 n=1 Tax=Lytechinus pictus TaxID=7653 RepID=UPI0030B9F21D
MKSTTSHQGPGEMDLTGKMFRNHLQGGTSPLWMPDIREIISENTSSLYLEKKIPKIVKARRSLAPRHCSQELTQLRKAGVYNDEQEVEWDIGFLRGLVAGLERTFKAKAECEIHCAIIVISALNLSLRAEDLTELIDQIKKMTGQPPIVVITHRKHHDVREEIIGDFLTGLQQQRIDYVYEVENYTTSDHEYDAEKHLVLLEALYQCCLVGDKVMKYRETNQGCVIL